MRFELNSMFKMIKQICKMVKWRELGVEYGNCSACGKTIFIKLRNNNMSAIRCISSQGPFFQYLLKRASHLTYSEYFDDVTPGAYKWSIQCQDVQALTYDSESFDICTSTEVFEHVPNDLKGFREIHRVLKPGGLFLFTVPLSARNKTIERVRVEDGKLIYLQRANYHDDRVRGPGTVLCYRDYGLDIVERLTQAGFSKTEIILVQAPTRWGYDSRVLAACK
jgi:SAM-dependent methyltransferase